MRDFAESNEAAEILNWAFVAEAFQQACEPRTGCSETANVTKSSNRSAPYVPTALQVGDPQT